MADASEPMTAKREAWIRRKVAGEGGLTLGHDLLAEIDCELARALAS